MSNLRESLRLFNKASTHLSSSKLSDAISEYNSLHFHNGSIDLALSCSNAWDPDERGLSWWKDGSPRGDSRAPSWEPRNFCYERVLETLQSVDDLLDSAVEKEGRGSVSGKSSLLQMSELLGAGKSLTGSLLLSIVEEADSLRSNAYSRALAAENEALHHKLYDWYISRSMTDQLLSIRSTFLETYLLSTPISLERYDLLWQYYARHYQHSKAASVLATLAESDEFEGQLALDKRLEYLSLAASNARSQFPTPGMREDTIEFLTSIEEKLEVGAVQVEIYRQVQELEDGANRPSSSNRPAKKEDMLAQLESRLYGISQLYADFAEPLGLLETQLLIFHVSDHRDTELVMRTWENLIQKLAERYENDEELVQALEGKVSELTRRFYPSEVALPLREYKSNNVSSSRDPNVDFKIYFLLLLAQLISLLEQFNKDDLTLPSTNAWLLTALHAGGVSYDLLFAIYDELYRSRISPWHTQSAASYLLGSISTIVTAWLKEVNVQGYGGSAGMGNFPAAEVELALGRYVADAGGSGSGDQGQQNEVKMKLEEALREIRRRF